MAIPNHDELRDLVALACRAPSVHNTQPWRWVYRHGVLALHADTRRQLMNADGNGRDLVVSCGAALHHLEVAARAAGWATSVTRLPDTADPTYLAAITFEPTCPGPGDARLVDAIWERRTDRRQVSSWPVPAARIEGLGVSAARLGVLLTPVDPGLQQDVFHLLSDAARAQRAHAWYLDELLAWTYDHVAGAGIPATSLLTRTATAKQPDVSTRFPTGSLDDEYQEESPPAAAWLLLSTSSDDTLSWLRTGEALSSVWLTCTLAGLVLVPYTQPVEVESTRAGLQAHVLGGTSCPQVLLRIGWLATARDAVPPTSRRPMDQVLQFPDQP